MNNNQDRSTKTKRQQPSSKATPSRKQLTNSLGSDVVAEATFDPNAEELTRSWFSGAKRIYCLNTFPNGITVSMHRNVEDDPENSFTANNFNLRLPDTREYQLPAGKLFLYKDDYASAFEGILSHLHKRGQLSDSVVYFGTTVDPFAALHKKFNVTMACLDLLEQYTPRNVIVQTRSPMVISALPMLKLIEKQVIVSISVETPLENMISRYTPGQPRVAERLVAADGFRAQGLTVALNVAPILPYGEYYRDAWDFAELLDRHADYITLGSLATGSVGSESQLRDLGISQRLEHDGQFRFLRPYAYRTLFYALRAVAPEKLLIPVKPTAKGQLNLFAA